MGVTPGKIGENCGLTELFKTYDIDAEVPSGIKSNMKRVFNNDVWSTVEQTLLKRSLLSVATQISPSELKTANGGGKDVVSLAPTQLLAGTSSSNSINVNSGFGVGSGSSTSPNIGSPGSPNLVMTSSGSPMSPQKATTGLAMPTVIDKDSESISGDKKALIDAINSGDVPLSNVLLMSRCVTWNLPNCIIFGIEVRNNCPCLYVYAKKRSNFVFASFRLLMPKVKNIKRLLRCVWFIFSSEKEADCFNKTYSIDPAARRFWIVDSHEFGRGYYITTNKTDISLKNIIREELEGCVLLMNEDKKSF